MRRLSPGTLIVGMFAILFGLLGAYGVKAYITQEPPPPAQETKVVTVSVPLAAMDLPAGRTVADGDVMMMPMTPEQIAKAKLPAIWMDKVAQITGRTLREPIKQGRPFEPTSFYPKGIGPNVAEDLKPGERAVTIPIKNDAVDGTFVTPGAIVDVLFRATPDEKADVPDATVTLLSRVRILAVGQITVAGTIAAAQEAGKTQAVTLAVNPTQARALKVVEGRGTLTLVLRNPADNAPADTGGPTTLPGLLGMKETTRPFVSEIYRRGGLATLTFVDGQRQKITLDPPYGLPVSRDPKDVPNAGLDVVLPPSPWHGYGGYGGWSGYSGYGWGSGVRYNNLVPPAHR